MSRAEQQAKTAAEDFRRNHRLGRQPLGDLVALIERVTGYDVAIVSAASDEHGLTMRDPAREAVFIGVAATDHPMRQRSSLAHELGHVVFGDWSPPETLGPRTLEEVRADSFARHLLLPLEGVSGLLEERRQPTEADLSDIVQHFLVSPAIAAIAIRDAGYIDQATAERWMKRSTRQLATRYGWGDQYASLQATSATLRAPQGLLARAIEGYAEGVVTAQTIATLQGVDVDRVIAELEEAGVNPSSPEPIDLSAECLPPVEVDLSLLETMT